jgi:hypothetical protein
MRPTQDHLAGHRPLSPLPAACTPTPPRRTPTLRVCRDCGQLRPHRALGRCGRCYHQDPARARAFAQRLADRLADPPSWLAGLVEFLTQRRSTDRAITLLRHLGILLETTPARSPTAVLQAIQAAGADARPLGRVLEAFGVQAGLLLPGDQAAQPARARRARRLAEIPKPFGALAARFNTAQQADQQRARRAGTKPRAERTLEINLVAIRDLARFLAAQRPQISGWEQVSVGDVEAFLATLRPSYRARQLAGLRGFFRYARTAKAILADPPGTCAPPPTPPSPAACSPSPSSEPSMSAGPPRRPGCTPASRPLGCCCCCTAPPSLSCVTCAPTISTWAPAWCACPAAPTHTAGPGHPDRPAAPARPPGHPGGVQSVSAGQPAHRGQRRAGQDRLAGAAAQARRDQPAAAAGHPPGPPGDHHRPGPGRRRLRVRRNAPAHYLADHVDRARLPNL